ncbi:phenylacetate--CoA ligase family protein [Mycoplasmatota bacterium]|nr:phenylacetate--CoA ligase family protein [Mycoplasmatota bacterium]
MERIFVFLRRIAFWSLDLLRGSKVRKAYYYVKRHEFLDSNSLELKESQVITSSSLIQHAKNTTIFYKDKGDILEDFPIINKNIIRDNQDDFISSNFDKSKLITMFTSGSTGTPFVCFQNKDKRKRVIAEIIYYSEKVGFKIGKNLINLRTITPKNNKSRLVQWVQNISLQNVGEYDKESIGDIIADIEKKSRYGSMLIGYASVYDALRDYFHKYGTSVANNSNIYGIVSGALMLVDETRESMINAFNCPCVSRYSNQENGIIGQDDVENNCFIINEANYIVEIFDMDKDALLEDGQAGRIVITDLFNKAMPMIRYDTGDIGAITYVERNGVMKRAIVSFGGRKIDSVYDIHGARISPHLISSLLWFFSKSIIQYQFIQVSEYEYEVNLTIDATLSNLDELKDKLLGLVGIDAILNINIVKEIPILSSGKRRYIVNEMVK